MPLGMKEGDLRDIMTEHAQYFYGRERAKELAGPIQLLAASITAISKYEIPLAEEPAFFR